jgi:hypothetical protein
MMKSTDPSPTPWQEQWLAQWKRAGVNLAAEREKALRQMSPQQALKASDVLLALAHPSKLSPARLKSSGLVEQLALFHRRLQK